MSKTTKIIAALGVVAGLGVAALPAFTYADTYTPSSVSGNADIYVEIEPAIAMTITGNNDDNSHAGAASSNAEVEVRNPVDIAMINGKDVSGFEDASIATKASSSYTKLLPGASVHGTAVSGDDNGFYSTITVFTNSVNGYNVGISELSALVNQTDNTATIPANGIVKAGFSGWGYATSVQSDASGTTAADANYLTAANPTLFYSDTASTATTGDSYKVYYGVSADGSQKTGVYKSSITYTATTKNAAH